MCLLRHAKHFEKIHKAVPVVIFTTLCDTVLALTHRHRSVDILPPPAAAHPAQDRLPPCVLGASGSVARITRPHATARPSFLLELPRAQLRHAHTRSIHSCAEHAEATRRRGCSHPPASLASQLCLLSPYAGNGRPGLSRLAGICQVDEIFCCGVGGRPAAPEVSCPICWDPFP